MAFTPHSQLTRDKGAHPQVSFHFPTGADRLADTNRDPSTFPLQVDHFVVQDDTAAVYRVTGLAPLAYQEISGGAPFELLATEPSIGFMEALPAGSPLPTSLTWWDSSAKNYRLLVVTITYAGALIVTVVYQYYDVLDAPTTSITETRTYVGSALATVERTITP